MVVWCWVVHFLLSGAIGIFLRNGCQKWRLLSQRAQTIVITRVVFLLVPSHCRCIASFTAERLLAFVTVSARGAQGFCCFTWQKAIARLKLPLCHPSHTHTHKTVTRGLRTHLQDLGKDTLDALKAVSTCAAASGFVLKNDNTIKETNQERDQSYSQHGKGFFSVSHLLFSFVTPGRSHPMAKVFIDLFCSSVSSVDPSNYHKKD